MPELVRLYIRNILLGCVLAVVFTTALIVLDVANLRHLTLETSGGWLGVVMLVVFNSIVFAGVQFAIAVMRMAEPGDGPRGGLRVPVLPAAGLGQPLPARATARGERDARR